MRNPNKKFRTWTGQYWMTEKHGKRISKKLKLYFKTHQIWNKGKHLVENPITNKIRRSDPDYYLKELEHNAMNEPKYRSVEKSQRDRMIKKIRADSCGYFGNQRWGRDEVSFLRENYKKISIECIALQLGRSFSSIRHKLQRLRLLKNHKWKQFFLGGR